jgi:hypothetical protein
MIHMKNNGKTNNSAVILTAHFHSHVFEQPDKRQLHKERQDGGKYNTEQRVSEDGRDLKTYERGTVRN